LDFAQCLLNYLSVRSPALPLPMKKRPFLIPLWFAALRHRSEHWFEGPFPSLERQTPPLRRCRSYRFWCSHLLIQAPYSSSGSGLFPGKVPCFPHNQSVLATQVVSCLTQGCPPPPPPADTQCRSTFPPRPIRCIREGSSGTIVSTFRSGS